MHQPLPSPQPLMTLHIQPMVDTNIHNVWQQMPEVVVDYQPPHSNASITSLPPNPTSETCIQSQISIAIQESTTLPNEPSIPPVTSDQKLTVTPMDVDQSGESPFVPPSILGTSSTSVLQTDITPGLNLPVQEDNQELKLPNI